MKRQSEAMIDRHEVYEQRFNRFLGKIRSYQNDELKKIGEKSNDEIQFQSNKIISDARQYDSEAFGKRHKAIDVESKIRKSRKTNQARLSKMKVRFQMIEKIQNQIKTRLVQLTADGQNYKQLLEKLTIQGLIKMLEQKVEVKCLRRDVQLVKQILPDCEKQFSDMCQVKTKLVLSNETLPQSDLGGIILTSFNGKIVCNNTLRARLEYALQQSLPEVRKNLFPTQIAQTTTQNTTQNTIKSTSSGVASQH